VPGHEIAGRVDACGLGVDGVEVGQRVAVEPISSCGDCRACRSGRPIWCRSAKLYGVHLPGGMADEIVVPAERVFTIDEALAPEVAALVEPVAVAVHAIERIAVAADERVLVLGAGTVGLVSVLAARTLGVRDVWATARHAHQAELASALGATRVLDAGEADAASLDALGRREDIDAVIETVGGRANTLELATAALRPGGRVSVLGLFDAPLEINPWTVLEKELSLVWSNCYARPRNERADFEIAARMVEAEREALAKLCTHQLPLAEVQRGFDVAGDKSSGAVKVTLLP
jgi:2-desacetyl-2-hydroxyethyl bacteriochlorophyllide A dehydrogenase